MRMPSPIFALVLIGLLHLCGCAQLGTVRPEELLLISPGISLGEARTRLGENNLHHHFTVERDGHVWRLFRCYLPVGDDQVDLLFKNGRFVKSLNVKRAVSFRGFGDGLQPWTPLDYGYVDQVIDSHDEEEVQKEIRRCLELMQRRKTIELPSLAALPLVVFAPLVMLEDLCVPPAMIAHRWAQDVLDGANRSLGETDNSVVKRLGKPATRVSSEEGVEVWTYFYLPLGHFLPRRNRALRLVLFFKNGRVHAIYNGAPDMGRCANEGWLVSPSW